MLKFRSLHTFFPFYLEQLKWHWNYLIFEGMAENTGKHLKTLEPGNFMGVSSFINFSSYYEN